MAVLVDATGLSVRRPERALFAELSLTVSHGERWGVVGINGTGKSTLLRVLGGRLDPDEGQLRWGRGARTGFLDQRPSLPAGSVRAAAGEGWEAEAVLDRLGMGSFAERDVATLSGGQAKRVALARVLAAPADLLILDEPTNHLDLAAITWLEERLAAFRGGLVLVSHDRHLLDRLTTRMLELDRGRAFVHQGGYAAYLEARFERESQAATVESTRRNLARRELAWLRRGAPARTRKPQARIDAARRVVEGQPEAAARGPAIDLAFGTPRLGDKVIEADGAGFRYSEGSPEVVVGVDLALAPRDRLAVVGLNGTGKSTLLELLAGRLAPTSGRVERGPTVQVGYYDQQGSVSAGGGALDLDARVRDLVAGPTRPPGAPEDLRLMERFWFGGEVQWARAGALSGGERRRLQLLLVLAERPNVLLLDEPTNDLDLETLRILEDFLEEWPGAVVTVSHDRAFLERTTERMMAIDEHGRLSLVAGGLAGWVSRAGGGRVGRLPTASIPATASAPATRRQAGPVRQTGPVSETGPVRGRSPSTLGHQLRQAERELDRLQGQRDQLGDELAAAADHLTLARIGSALTEVQAQLNRVEEDWLALAEERENVRPL